MTVCPTPEDFIVSRDCFLIDNTSPPIQLVYYTMASYHNSHYDYYGIQRPEGFSTWAPRRQAQFLAGRIAAAEAIDASHTVDRHVAVGQSREPVWPAGLAGSISHDQQLSIARVKQPQKPHSGLGIDIQSAIEAKTQALIFSTIVTQDEKPLFKKSPHEVFGGMLFTLIFSAKESFFKALFGTVGGYFDFDAVCVVKIDYSSQQLTLKALKTLDANLPLHFEAEVSFALLGNTPPQIITSCSWEL